MAISEEMIRLKAYQLWETRGCPTGSAESDWLEAERLLLEEQETPGEPAVDPTPRYGLRRLAPGE